MTAHCYIGRAVKIFKKQRPKKPVQSHPPLLTACCLTRCGVPTSRLNLHTFLPVLMRMNVFSCTEESSLDYAIKVHVHNFHH